jgi:hypothetical protein
MKKKGDLMASWLIPLILGGASIFANKQGNKKPQTTQYPTMSPEQQAFQNKILEMLGGQLGEGGDEEFNAFAAPYKRQFEEQTIPGISERFAGLGGLSSSGFTQSLGQAGAGLNEKLAALQQGLKSERFNRLLPFAFQKNFHTDVEKGGQNWLAELLGPILQGYGSGLGGNLANMGFGGK